MPGAGHAATQPAKGGGAPGRPLRAGLQPHLQPGTATTAINFSRYALIAFRNAHHGNEYSFCRRCNWPDAVLLHRAGMSEEGTCA